MLVYLNDDPIWSQLEHQDRFWSRVTMGCLTECWEWEHCVDTSGYGLIGAGYKTHKTHRVSYLLNYGYINTTRCWNPTHLRQGTSKDNSDDKFSRGRQRFTSGKQQSTRGKLTLEEVKFIREYGRAFTMRHLAVAFDTDSATISNIVNNKNYRWLE